MVSSSVGVKDVNCENLSLGEGYGEPHFSLTFTKDDKVFCKIRDKEEIELDYEKMYNFLKEHFKK